VAVPGVPSSAGVAAEGYGDVRWEAPAAGRVWVANVTRGYVVVAEDVSRGDGVKVFPSKDRVEIAGRVAAAQNLESRDRHAVYFRDGVIRPRGGGGSGGYGSIPRGAERVASGVGSFSWRAEAGGTIWLGDDKTRTVLLTQPVRAGDLVEVDAESDFVRVNGRDVYRQNLESRHTLSIFWR
jgi:predicted RNA-binding protein with TRAM domain